MYFCSIQRPNMEIFGRIFVGMEAGSSPLCLELCLCLLVAVPGRGHGCAVSPQSSSAVPRDPSDPSGVQGPLLPVQAAHGSCTERPPAPGADVHRAETSTNHLPAGTAKTWEAIVSFLLPRRQGPALWSCAL